MVVEVRRKENESSESLIRRFMNRVRLSGIRSEAIKHQYHTRKLNKRARRVKAQRRAELTAKYDNLRKLGLLDDFDGRGRSFRER